MARGDFTTTYRKQIVAELQQKVVLEASKSAPIEVTDDIEIKQEDNAVTPPRHTAATGTRDNAIKIEETDASDHATSTAGVPATAAMAGHPEPSPASTQNTQNTLPQTMPIKIEDADGPEHISPAAPENVISTAELRRAAPTSSGNRVSGWTAINDPAMPRPGSQPTPDQQIQNELTSALPGLDDRRERRCQHFPEHLSDFTHEAAAEAEETAKPVIDFSLMPPSAHQTVSSTGASFTTAAPTRAPPAATPLANLANEAAIEGDNTAGSSIEFSLIPPATYPTVSSTVTSPTTTPLATVPLATPPLTRMLSPPGARIESPLERQRETQLYVQRVQSGVSTVRPTHDMQCTCPGIDEWPFPENQRYAIDRITQYNQDGLAQMVKVSWEPFEIPKRLIRGVDGHHYVMVHGVKTRLVRWRDVQVIEEGEHMCEIACEDSWEPLENLDHAADSIGEYKDHCRAEGTDWERHPVGQLTGYEFHCEYGTDYGPAFRALMAASGGSDAARLAKFPADTVRRPLLFHKNTTQVDVFRDGSKVACLAYMCGPLRINRCESCQAGRGLFQECVVFPGRFGDSCCSCGFMATHYEQCSFHHSVRTWTANVIAEEQFSAQDTASALPSNEINNDQSFLPIVAGTPTQDARPATPMLSSDEIDNRQPDLRMASDLPASNAQPATPSAQHDQADLPVATDVLAHHDRAATSMAQPSQPSSTQCNFSSSSPAEQYGGPGDRSSISPAKAMDEAFRCLENLFPGPGSPQHMPFRPLAGGSSPLPSGLKQEASTSPTPKRKTITPPTSSPPAQTSERPLKRRRKALLFTLPLGVEVVELD